MKPVWVYVLFVGGLPAYAQYAGPAVLSRGEAPSSLALPDIKIRPFLSASGTYNTGLSNVSVNDTGDLANQAAYGTTLGFGVSGTHNWRRTKLGLTYRGGISHFHNKSSYDSTDHSLLLGVRHQIARHITLNFQTSAGMFQRDFGILGLPQTSLYDPSTVNIPTTDFFDNRTYYLSSSLGLSIQKTARLSFNFSGGVFFNKRRSRALYGSFGQNASGDVQYRISRRNTIGAAYNYAHYSFTRVFGGTHAQTVVGTFARQLSRTVEFSAYAGVVRPEVTFIQTVQIDPAIVALLGIAQGTRLLHTINYSPSFGARISKSMETGTVYGSVTRGINPGNGLFLTSISTAMAAGYAYSGLRHWSAASGVTYNKSDAQGFIVGQYETVSATATLSRTLRYNMHFTMNYSVRKYLSGDYIKYNRLINQATVGVSWSPGEVPLRVW